MKQKNYRKLHKTCFIWYTASEKMKTLQTLWACECLKTSHKNQQLWFVDLFNCIFRNPFFPDKNSKLYSYKKLTNTARETLLNELFTLNPENNEQTINKYIKQRQINMTWPTLTALCWSTILVYLKLLSLDRFSLCIEKIMNTEKIDETFFGKG